jgi:hypothetical protein
MGSDYAALGDTPGVAYLRWANQAGDELTEWGYFQVIPFVGDDGRKDGHEDGGDDGEADDGGDDGAADDDGGDDGAADDGGDDDGASDDDGGGDDGGDDDGASDDGGGDDGGSSDVDDITNVLDIPIEDLSGFTSGVRDSATPYDGLYNVSTVYILTYE